MSETIINIGLIVTYILVALAVISTLFFGLLQIVRNFGKAKGALIGMVVLLAIVLISFALSSGEPYPDFQVGAVASRWIGAGITTTFVLVVLASLAAVYTEIKKLFS